MLPDISPDFTRFTKKLSKIWGKWPRASDSGTPSSTNREISSITFLKFSLLACNARPFKLCITGTRESNMTASCREKTAKSFLEIFRSIRALIKNGFFSPMAVIEVTKISYFCNKRTAASLLEASTVPVSIFPSLVRAL